MCQILSKEENCGKEHDKVLTSMTLLGQYRIRNKISVSATLRWGTPHTSTGSQRRVSIPVVKNQGESFEEEGTFKLSQVGGKGGGVQTICAKA